MGNENAGKGRVPAGKSNAKRRLPEEYLLDCKDQEMVRLYRELRRRLVDVLPEFNEYAVQNYIGLSNDKDKIFAEIHVQRGKIRITTLEPKTDDEQGCKVPDSHEWKLNYKSELRNEDEMDAIIDVIRQSYANRN